MLGLVLGFFSVSVRVRVRDKVMVWVSFSVRVSG